MKVGNQQEPEAVALYTKAITLLQNLLSSTKKHLAPGSPQLQQCKLSIRNEIDIV